MKQLRLLTIVAAFGVLSVMTSISDRQAHAQEDSSKDAVQPIVFQAAGPDAASIQGTVDAFRAAWEPTTAIRRGRSPAVAARSTGTAVAKTTRRQPPVTPFDVFLNTRGAQFTTQGTGLTQAPPRHPSVPATAAWPLFNNPTYATSSARSARCACSPRSAATSPMRCSSCPAPMARHTARSMASARSSRMLISRMAIWQTRRAVHQYLIGTSVTTASCCSVLTSRPRRATGACPSSDRVSRCAHRAGTDHGGQRGSRPGR